MPDRVEQTRLRILTLTAGAPLGLRRCRAAHSVDVVLATFEGLEQTGLNKGSRKLTEEKCMPQPREMLTGGNRTRGYLRV